MGAPHSPVVFSTVAPKAGTASVLPERAGDALTGGGRPAPHGSAGGGETDGRKGNEPGEGCEAGGELAVPAQGGDGEAEVGGSEAAEDGGGEEEEAAGERARAAGGDGVGSLVWVDSRT